MANDVDTYYETHGNGLTLLLLHGGLDTIEAFRPHIAALSPRYRLALPERRGHGRTADQPGPITYDLMAEDTIAFMEALALGRCHVAGWSDGAIVAMIVAMRRPDLVDRLVLISANYDAGGMRPEFAECAEYARAMTPEAFEPRLVEVYGRLSPDGPQHFPIVLARMQRLFLEEPKLREADLARIAAPTLVMAADRDLVDLDHTLRLFRAQPDAQLAIVPGTTHEGPIEKPELVCRLIEDFLDG